MRSTRTASCTITGRIKELFKTSGGKYIAPPAIEAKFKAICPLRQPVHGASATSATTVVALVALDPDAIADWAKENNVDGTSYEEIVGSDACRAMVGKYVERAQRPAQPLGDDQEVELLDHDLTVESGELTPSMKVKRNVVESNYKDVIDKLYA